MQDKGFRIWGVFKPWAEKFFGLAALCVPHILPAGAPQKYDYQGAILIIASFLGCQILNRSKRQGLGSGRPLAPQS